ncbi:nuclear transport factor 2 family protein [Roseomonas sp. PWR1]|uniref:Nuclear transport factor 2 family protein n=1 Tax=Roseomonas nitratireducens TaxID=2820810 RepID=A0ABS4AV62_9PROT|nr:ketosteroid isomerase-related protein [Neoroseomonas nitratireducens]MBP0464442.1 nuclear transport factor 2 family protein [Neoroseomonas nitratireducens]
MDAAALIRAYLDAFNRGDRAAMLALLADDVAHDVNQGPREVGRDAFAAFLARMDRCYRERLEDIVVMSEPGGTRAAAEFTVLGEYVATDEGLPEARGQRYALPAGAFYDIRDGRIARVTMFYNLHDWIAQVSAAS